MPENNITQEFLQKLAPCIERGDLDACVEETARVAREMEIESKELLDLSTEKGVDGDDNLAYVLALAAAPGLEGKEKAQAFFNAGIGMMHFRKKKKAEKYYKMAIEFDPNDPASHNNYGVLLADMNHHKVAEVQYKKALEIDPNYAPAHCNYGILLYEQDRYEEAEEHYKKALEISPDDSVNHNNYANLLMNTRRYDDAEEHFKKAIELDPESETIRNNYKILQSKLNRYK
jgi:tetratricopeptide (TPR) repeat protein